MNELVFLEPKYLYLNIYIQLNNLTLLPIDIQK